MTSLRRLNAFAARVAAHLGREYPRAILEAALGAVSVHPKQAGSKLSPVRIPERDTPARAGPVPKWPFVVASYASFDTCPASCQFLGCGCMVETNVNARRGTDRLDERARMLADLPERHVLVALAEAFKLEEVFVRLRDKPRDGARGGRDVRLHVSGDAIGIAPVEVLGACATSLKSLGSGSIWTFTHAALLTDRSRWGNNISVLASVETASGALAVMERGYVPALTVQSFLSDRAFTIDGVPNVEFVPCPAETARRRLNDDPVTCATCRLCLDDRALQARGRGIAFATHGQGARVAASRVRDMRDAEGRYRRGLVTLR